jgi:hypothetical protein
MRVIRSLTLFAAAVALLLVASSATAAYYTFVGRLTTNRGRATNVPMAGTQNCGSLTIRTNGFKTHTMPVIRGVNTQPGAGVALTNAFNWKTKTGGGMFKNLDQGCVKAVLPLKTNGGGPGVGQGFSLPPKAFHLPYPRVRHPAFYMFKTDIPVVEIKNFTPAVQLATSADVTAAPAVRAHYGGTQGTMGMLGGVAKHAAFRQFKPGAFATQTGRAAAKFSWCPPPLSMLSSAPGVTGCLGTGSGGFPALINYSGGGSAFGGTMSMVTHQVAGVGSMGLQLGGPIAFNNFGGGESLGTGRGYADFNHIVLSSGDIHASGTIMTRYIGPVLGNQKVIGMVNAAVVGMWPGGDVYDWGFPWTTMTVKIKAHNGANTRKTTFTAKGWDCAGNKEGPACSKTPTMGVVGGVNRNISLVSGSIGIARLPPPFGDAPIANMGNMQMLVLPEPGETLQMLAGVVGLLAVAAWRSRRVR